VEGRIILALAALVGLGSAAWGSEAQEFVLARNKAPLASIVTPKEVGSFLKSAVDDLAACLEKVSGARVPVVQEGSPVEGCAIHVGQTDLVKSAGLPLEGLSVDGYVIAPRQNSIFICGRTDDGTSNGIYGFLRDSVGVRWFMPGDLWEVVPKADPLVVKVTETRSEPDYSFRIWSGFAGDEGAKYAFRNRFDRHRRDIPLYGFGHNLKRIFPVSKYGKEHPEYYAEINGKRFVPESDEAERSQPCLTNPDVIRITVETARDFFANYPTATMFSLCANDNADFCTCPNCSKLDSPPVKCRHGWRTYSDSYFYYVEQVAKEVAKTNPDKKLGCYVYWTTLSVPRHIKRLPDNVVVCLCQDTSQHHDPKYREHDRNLYLAWAKVARYVARYDYYGLGWFSPRYFPHLAADDLKFCHENGAVGLYCELYPYWPITGPQIYLATQVLWDSHQDTDAVLDEYFTKLYENAAPTMKEFYSLLERVWLKERRGWWFQGLDSIGSEAIVFDADAMAKALNLLNKARDESSGTARERVEYTRSSFKFSYLIVTGFDAAISLSKLPLESRADVEHLAREMERMVSLVNLTERTFAGTLGRDPLHSHHYYSDNEQFRKKFDDWEDYVVGPAVSQLMRIQNWATRNMDSAEAQKFVEGIAGRLSKVEIRRSVNFIEKLTPALEIHRAPREIKVDGNLDDWSGASWTPIGDGAPAKISAEFAAAWDDANFYFACKVRDDVHLQKMSGVDIWKQDAVQIGFDTLCNGWESRWYQADDYEYGLALTESGPLAWGWQGVGGKARKVQVEISRSGNMTLYEAVIPWSALKPLRPSAGRIFAMSVLVDNDDGAGRTYIAWGGGLATRKDPRQFKLVRFLGE